MIWKSWKPITIASQWPIPSFGRSITGNSVTTMASAPTVAASRGSHDEWNIVRLINERRRHDEQEFDRARQFAVLFDGQAVAPGPVETVTAPGYLG
jgi:hypothetical protein